MHTTTLKAVESFSYFVQAKASRAFRLAPESLLFPVIWVTDRCNLRCRMCDQWKTPPEASSQELSTEEWFSVIDAAARLHALAIVITGGEPLLRKDIVAIVRHMHTRGIASHICSNGTLLDRDRVAFLREAGLHSISVSLDSHLSQVHNDMRGADSFDAARNGIRLLRQEAPRVRVGINCVITRKNFRGLDRMFPFAEGLGVHLIKFDLVHTNLMHRRKPRSSFDDLLFTEDDLPALCAEVKKLIAAAGRTRLLTNSRTFLRGIPAAARQQPLALRCYAGYLSCAIDAQGRVSLCDNFDGAQSVRTASLCEIWRGEQFRRLRRELSGCRCCWDTTHTELNIRCRLRGLPGEVRQILKEVRFYAA